MLWFGRLAALVALVLTLTLPYASNDASATVTAAAVDPQLTQLLRQQARVPAFIVLRNQADTSFARHLPSKQAKGAAVVAALRAQAQRDQPALLKWLDQRGITGRGFISVNAISAEIDAATLSELLKRPEVAEVASDMPQQRLDQPQASRAPLALSGVEAGVSAVNAPDVWALGYRGQGIVVAGEDTGVRWTHSALKEHYRGWNGASADHNYNWHDGVANPGAGNPCGSTRLTAPCDDNTHGSHTVGTMVGDDGGSNQIGVAPEAKWIACRNMDAGNGTIATYVDCIDWMLAPYPISGTVQDGDPSKAPDVINNSWGCPPSEGCSGSTLDDIQPSIINVTNAGIMFVSSAGNNGSSCETVLDPPAIYPESFSVAAYSPTTGSIASFSSRGPITYNGQTRLGPNIAAPGVSTRSVSNGGDSSYTSLSGTSMAAPHVAGVVALVWSARPELRGQVGLTRRILQETATPTQQPSQTCGGVPGTEVPNNTWGYGKVNALAAISTSLNGTITVDSAAPVTATLSVTDGDVVLDVNVAATGAYSTTLPSGTYTVTASVAGFAPQSAVVTIGGRVVTQDFAFGGTTQGVLTGMVTLDGSAAPTATIQIEPGSFTPVVDSSGVYSITLDEGAYTVTASLAGFAPQSATVFVSGNVTNTQDFAFVTQAGQGTLNGTVLLNGAPALTATVMITPGGLTLPVDSSGVYSATLATGTYTVTAHIDGYADRSVVVALSEGAIETRDFVFFDVRNTLYLPLVLR